MSFGERLINLREENGISRKDLATKLEIPYTTLRNYETDAREPGHLFLIKAARFFGVTIDYLLEIEKNKKTIDVNSYPVGNIFALKIKGRSMEPRIFDGDTAIVKKQTSLNDGEIGVVKIGENVTTKKIVRQDGGLLLVGLNSAAFTPKFYPDSEIEIIGKVIEIHGNMDGWEK